MRKETAILVALFGKPKMFHGSYIAEKLVVVLEHGANEGVLDSKNVKRFKELMEMGG